MTTAITRDVSTQSDVGKMKVEADGSYKRTASSFRDTIAVGSKFEPEAGAAQSRRYRRYYLMMLISQTDTISTSLMPAVRQIYNSMLPQVA
jgi:glutathionyl-hydroquinone reductase